MDELDDYEIAAFQFPRLLSELNAVINDEIIYQAAESMDLHPSEVKFILDKAESVFESLNQNGNEALVVIEDRGVLDERCYAPFYNISDVTKFAKSKIEGTWKVKSII